MPDVGRVLSGGRITIPAPMLKELRLKVGDLVMLRWEDGGKALKVIPVEVKAR